MIERLSRELDQRIPAKFDSWQDRAVHLLVEYKLAIYVALAAGAALLFTDLASVSVPEPVEIILIGIAVGIIPAVFLGIQLADRWLPDPRMDVLVIEDDPPDARIVKVPRQLWQNRQINGLTPWIPEGDSQTDAIVTEIDHEPETNTLTVRGCNPELADPVEIVARDGMLQQVFGDLVETARELKMQEATEATRQIETEGRAINEMIRAVETGGSMDPGAFEDLIDQDDRDDQLDDPEPDQSNDSNDWLPPEAHEDNALGLPPAFGDD